MFDGDRRRAFSFSGEVKISGAVADLLEEIKIPTSGKTGPEMGHPGSSLTNDRKSKSPPVAENATRVRHPGEIYFKLYFKLRRRKS